MSAMGRLGIKRLKIKEKDFELELEQEDRYPSHAPSPHSFQPPFVHEHPHTAPSKTLKERHDIPTSLHPPLDQHQKPLTLGKFISSPMVGTFYSSPGPDEPPFVKIGDQVEKDTVVCIIEAMKVMNEVKAGCSGTVSEMLVEDGHPIEFGTKLYKISE